jgi:MFS family permease
MKSPSPPTIPPVQPTASGFRSHLTLTLCAILHAFTHAYGSMLVPLYLLMVADLHLSGVKQASLIVSIYTLVYCIGAYAAGWAADHFNRKMLLGIGLLINAVAIVLIGLTRRYDLLLCWAVLAGLGGTIFHPAAGALVTAHYPRSPGMAVGLLGVGSGIGFFVGPHYSGWRAQAAQWAYGSIAQWQKPCIEMGIAGIVCGLLFLLIAKEVDDSISQEPHLAPRENTGGNHAGNKTVSNSSDSLACVHAGLNGHNQSWRILAIGAILGFRDFAGVAGLSLAGIYLQRAYHINTKDTGAILGTMMLLSVLVNPTLVWLTPGRRRLPTMRVILILGGIIAASVPFFGASFALPILCAFQTCQMGSYALSDAALLERSAGIGRGRVYGLFFVVAGTMGASGPWLMGWWTDALGVRADSAMGYVWPFASLGAAMMISIFAIPLIARLGPAVTKVDPITEIMPSSVEPAG